MPLSLSKYGVAAKVRRIAGSTEVRKRLETLGFTAGSSVTVVSEVGGDLIVNVKDARVALSHDLACSIFV